MNIAGLHGEESHAIKKQYKKKEKRILAGGIFILVSVLAYLKYYNFFIQNANILLHGVGSQLLLEAKILVLPIGISFYTLQAIGYIIDVSWGKIDGQQHPGKVALFLGFFPQIMEGPISLYSQTADTLWAGTSLRGENISKGCIRILWGYSKNGHCRPSLCVGTGCF